MEPMWQVLSAPNSTGVAGVAWNVKIMPVRVVDKTGSATDSTLSQGIQWAVDHGANIINLSLGAEITASEAATDSGFPLTVTALKNAYESGVTVVAAAGNESHYVDFPANYSHVIAVSAVDYQGNITSYSNYGSEILVCAPGGDGSSQTDAKSWVVSTTYDKLNGTDNIYIGMCGTSMACPHIAGLAALLYSYGVITPDAIRSHLKMNSTRDDYYGYGLPNAYMTLKGVSASVATAKVFYALSDGTVGTMTSPKISGAYTISSVPAGTIYVCAFIDVDGDSNVSSGDYFAYTTLSMTSNANLTLKNLSLKKVSIGSSKTLSNFIKNGFQ
jgi:serine protease